MSKRGGDDGAEPRPKRTKAKHKHQSFAIDPTWGQKYVFSELDDATTIPPGEEDDFEDDADAMAYLTSVRQQASSIPHLLVAPKVQIGPHMPAGFRAEQDSDEEGEVDEGADPPPDATDPRGYYEDGAYIGAPADWEEKEDDVDSAEAFREAYFATLRQRYRRLRERLRSPVPADAETRLTAARPDDAPLSGRHFAPAAVLAKVVDDTDPHPLQVALLPKRTVLRILRVMMRGRLMQQGAPIGERTSRWLWALLARLPDAWELNHLEIGCIRDLGRRAVLLGTDLVQSADYDEDEEYDEAEYDDQGEYEGDLLEEEQRSGGEPEMDDDDAGSSDDVAMDLASPDTEADEGEVVVDDAPPGQQDGTALEEAKRALLAKLAEAQSEDEADDEETEQRARINTRATLSMVITVAGEFYGQRDLLEFREPFAL